MPPLRLSERKAIPSQQGDSLTTAPRLAVVAKPTDPFIPGQVSSGMQDLLLALGAVSKGADAAGHLAVEAYAKPQREEGERAAKAGEEPPADPSAPYRAGYYRVKGQKAGADYAAELSAAFAQNSHLPPDQWEKVKAGVRDKYLKQFAGNTHALDGFLEESPRVEELFQLEYQKKKNLDVIAETRANAGAALDGKIKFVLDQAAAGIGIPLADGAESIGTSMANRQLYEDGKEAFRADVAPKLRAILDEARENYKELGMTTREISAAQLALVGRLAANTGMEDLLDYALIKDEKKGNISVKDAFPEQFDQFADQARTMGHTISAAMAKKAADEKKDALNLRNKNRYMQIATMKDPKDAIGLMNDIAADPEIDAEVAFKMTSHLNDVVMRGGYPEKDNEAVYRRLEAAIESGAITGNGARELLLSYGTELSHPTFQYLNTRITAREEKLADKRTEHGFSRYTREVSAFQAQIEQTLGQKDSMGKALMDIDPKSAIQLQLITSDGLAMYFRGLGELRQKFGGEENIPSSDIKALHDRVLTTFRPSVDRVLGMQTIGAPAAAAPGAAPAGAPVGGGLPDPNVAPAPRPAAPRPAQAAAPKAPAKPREKVTTINESLDATLASINGTPAGRVRPLNETYRFMTAEEWEKVLTKQEGAKGIAKWLADTFTATGAGKTE